MWFVESDESACKGPAPRAPDALRLRGCALAVPHTVARPGGGRACTSNAKAV